MTIIVSRCPNICEFYFSREQKRSDKSPLVLKVGSNREILTVQCITSTIY